VIALPVVLALDEDQETLEVLENQLTQRYAHDYRVECVQILFADGRRDLVGSSRV
jgi:hypothetical protein